MSTYVKFLVRDLNADVLRSMRIHARKRRIPLAEHLRQILCAHFEMDCRPSRARPRRRKGATTLSLRMQPELHWAVKEEARMLNEAQDRAWKEKLEAAVRGELDITLEHKPPRASMQSVVREALEAPYREVAA